MKTMSEKEAVSAIADKMLHYGDGCTRDQLRAHFSDDILDRYGDLARAEANDRAEHHTRQRVSAQRAA